MEEGIDMSFITNTYKNILSDITITNRQSIITCDVCHKKFNTSDPIIIQFKNGESDYTSCHVSCFFNLLKQNCPDFWKQYILEMI